MELESEIEVSRCSVVLFCISDFVVVQYPEKTKRRTLIIQIFKFDFNSTKIFSTVHLLGKGVSRIGF